MRDLLDDIRRWRAAGTRIALARVVDIEGSGPRGPGAAMAVNEDGEVSGSVSGGCVEGAVVGEALEVLAAGQPRTVSFGYSDDDAFAVGLTCGGTIHLFIQPIFGWSVFDRLAASIEAGDPVVLATQIEGPDRGATILLDRGGLVLGALGDDDLERVAVQDGLGQLDVGGTTIRRYGIHGESLDTDVTLFCEAFVPPPTMLIFGAIDFSAALARIAKVLGYRVIVADAREAFATRRRFPMADEVIVDWPNRVLERLGDDLGPRDAVCVLTHDAKFDVPAIVGALRTDVGYIGAMGSRRTHTERMARLHEAGATPAQLERVMSPIGLALRARTPEETAIAICAEIIALRGGGAGVSLRDSIGPVHAALPAAGDQVGADA